MEGESFAKSFKEQEHGLRVLLYGVYPHNPKTKSQTYNIEQQTAPLELQPLLDEYKDIIQDPFLFPWGPPRPLAMLIERVERSYR